ncbi:hypothetical protein RB594_004184 [Gaeumannomyces avenae]
MLDTPLPHTLLPILLPLAFYLPPFPHRGAVFGVLICATAAACAADEFPRADRVARYALNGFWIFYFPVLEKLLLHERPERDFWRLGGGQQQQQSGEATTTTRMAAAVAPWSWQKARWALALVASPRAVGWSHSCWRGRRRRGVGGGGGGGGGEDVAGDDAPGQKQHKGQGRTRFVLGQLARALVGTVTIEAATMVGRRLLLRAGRGAPRPLMELLMGATVWGSWTMQYGVAAAAGVGLGLSEAEDWPPIFGSVAAADSVAGFWGEFWHGILRQPALGFSHYFVQRLGIARGMPAAHAVHLLTAFGFSALFHVVSLYPISKGYVPVTDLCVGMFVFFLRQAVAILAETAVSRRYQGPLSADSPRRLPRWVGYLWVSTWLGVSSWPFVRIYLALGAMEWRAPFQILEPCLKALGPHKRTWTNLHGQALHTESQRH